MIRKEKEVFGSTYDRMMISELHKILTRKYNIRTALEMPSFGAKGAPSLYSLGFAKMGVYVTLPDFDEKMSKYWERLDLIDRLSIKPQENYYHTNFESNSFDVVWNFITFSHSDDPEAILKEMVRTSNKYIHIISLNSFQLGSPWHRFLHKILNIEWNHGDSYYSYPWNMKKSLRNHGCKIAEYGTIDSPPWPDPVGFRDIRLHKKKMTLTLDTEKQQIEWEVPFLEYFKTENYPLWMRFLRVYDIALHRYYFKLPFSHLFYVVAEKTT